MIGREMVDNLSSTPVHFIYCEDCYDRIAEDFAYSWYKDVEEPFFCDGCHTDYPEDE